MLKYQQIKYDKTFLIIITSLLVLSFIGTLLIPIRENYDWQLSSRDEIPSAAQSVVIGNRTFTLDILLIINYMPGAYGRTSGTLRIIPEDELDFPEGLDVTRVWLESTTWIITRLLAREYNILPPNKLHKSLDLEDIDVIWNGELLNTRVGYVQLTYRSSVYYLMDDSIRISEVD